MTNPAQDISRKYPSSRYLAQAVSERMSLLTLLTLVRIAKEPGCEGVRYMQPRPIEFGLFIENSAAKPGDFPSPQTLSLNELFAQVLPVLEKIQEFDENIWSLKRQLSQASKEIGRLEILLAYYYDDDVEA